MTVHVWAAGLILGIWFVAIHESPEVGWRLRWWFRAGLSWMLIELLFWRQMEQGVGRVLAAVGLAG